VGEHPPPKNRIRGRTSIDYRHNRESRPPDFDQNFKGRAVSQAIEEITFIERGKNRRFTFALITLGNLSD
jgi:hypothetical protein